MIWEGGWLEEWNFRERERVMLGRKIEIHPHYENQGTWRERKILYFWCFWLLMINPSIPLLKGKKKSGKSKRKETIFIFLAPRFWDSGMTLLHTTNKKQTPLPTHGFGFPFSTNRKRARSLWDFDSQSFSPCTTPEDMNFELSFPQLLQSRIEDATTSSPTGTPPNFPFFLTPTQEQPTAIEKKRGSPLWHHRGEHLEPFHLVKFLPCSITKSRASHLKLEVYLFIYFFYRLYFGYFL